ncbi:glycosyl transferase, group 1 family protein, putative [Methylophaga frappieri]|uniref:Glycosyl transferase, group 1 family protein, putative n=1 Tax=Methylophaga frappieri (strain ATCC BAA-2434 / DSM 25690 / JAM7) TaxID=754477 RepID=I1YKK4_METFJ|nr:glycosyltransferase family 1 protein [Methylophaga frappieri]AFJ03447.1 glycosyl transferase, group 1 family protein, putative [Methylophaga frappieri]
MKLFFDVDVIRAPLTGIGRYALNLAQAFATHPEIASLHLVRQGKVLSPTALSAPVAQSRSVTTQLRQSLASSSLGPMLRSGQQRLADQRLWRQTRHQTGAVYHSPQYQLRRFHGPRVSTVHDLSFLRFPEFHLPARVNYWRDMVHQTAKQADHIITDSAFQKQEIMALLGVEASRITAIHLGVSPFFQPVTGPQQQTELAAFGLTAGGFNLMVGTLEPRKNHQRVIQSFMNLPLSMRQAFPLVITGDPGWLSADVQKQIQRGRQQGVIRYTGYVDEVALRALYSGCRLFLYPSLYEGFGLPVLEAMACGALVMTSQHSAMAEFADGAAILVDPQETDAITTAWSDLLLDETAGLSLRAQARQRAAQLTWQQCADATCKVYHQLG